ncbi:aspartate 1-decarboxylase [Aureibacillus halotolerans]|uniref:Aspartate 1-decarboxylase n=1 Tax=Aureibacillus halotolerans TaxID=1508390 RepID=A0A4R6U4U2_9BACI|nr:aspartate 1-decarboxylase [Aureibacillus halotolerans]TDQ41500.1 L-aspartate 1-decarboxylase [Aureibacillus halotolerans]
MMKSMMYAKLHNATVTEANLRYVGSITIDEDLLDQVGMIVHERVQVVNNNNGARLETYIIPGERGSGVICLNGAAARLVQEGDQVIIMAYGLFSAEELISFSPKIAILDQHNRVQQLISQEEASTIL